MKGQNKGRNEWMAWSETYQRRESRCRYQTTCALLGLMHSYRYLSPHIICYQKFATYLRHVFVSVTWRVFGFTVILPFDWTDVEVYPSQIWRILFWGECSFPAYDLLAAEVSHSFLSRIWELKNFLYDGIHRNLRRNGKPFPVFPFWCMENSRRLRRIILVNSFIDYKF